MIQDIAPHIFHNEYKQINPTEQSYVFCFKQRSVLLAGNTDEIILPRVADIGLIEDPIYLFSIDSDDFFLADIPGKIPSGFITKDINIFRTSMQQHFAFACITAFSLWNWYQNHTWCGRCGKPMQRDSKERMLKCAACGNMEYPRISPAVIVGVTDGDRLLLSKYAGREYTGYSLLAGFSEIGETLEETIRREVMEEVGLRVKNPVYYKSQPWGLTDTILVGFFAELDGDNTITLDRRELAVAEWFLRDQVPPADSNISLTAEMMECFRKNARR